MRLHRFTLPLPFPPRTVHVHLTEGDEGLVLVDTGLGSRGSREALGAALGAIGRRVEDIGTVVLTHAHPDHAGEAGRLRRRHGARIVAHVDEVYALAGGGTRAERRGRALGALAGFGVPRRLRWSAAAAGLLEGLVAADTGVDLAVGHGHRLHLDGETIELLHVPGHATGHVVVHLPDRRTLLSADHLLPGITPVPLLQFPADRARPRALIDFLGSLERVESLPLDRVLPSHGDPFEDHRGLIARYRARHRERQDEVLEALAARPRSAFEVAEAIFGRRAHSQMVLTLSEAVGHLEVLEAADRVRATDRDGVTFYAVPGRA